MMAYSDRAITKLTLSRTPILGVLFDMDGTLLDSQGAVEEIWKRWSIRTGADYAAILAYNHGRPARMTMKQMLPELDLEPELA
ncbi:MAG: hypothetical protein EOP09_17780, partial [Proteobacteria bacterium]